MDGPVKKKYIYRCFPNWVKRWAHDLEHREEDLGFMETITLVGQRSGLLATVR